MRNSKTTYFFRFHEGYCAGVTTRYYCTKAGKPTEGNIIGSGWGATPKAARKAAKRSQKIFGNVNIEYVYNHTELYKNGKLIKETF